MSRTAVFKSVSAISADMGVKPSPVRTLELHIDFYTNVPGLSSAHGPR